MFPSTYNTQIENITYFLDKKNVRARARVCVVFIFLDSSAHVTVIRINKKRTALSLYFLSFPRRRWHTLTNIFLLCAKFSKCRIFVPFSFTSVALPSSIHNGDEKVDKKVIIIFFVA